METRKGFVLPLVIVVFIIVLSFSLAIYKLSISNAKGLINRVEQNDAYYVAKAACEAMYAFLSQADPDSTANLYNSGDYINKMQQYFTDNGSQVIKSFKVNYEPVGASAPKLVTSADIKVYWNVKATSTGVASKNQPYAEKVQTDKYDTHYFVIVAKAFPLNDSVKNNKNARYVTMVFHQSKPTAYKIYDGDIIGEGVD